jgi:predicted ATP-dependent serine protease
MGKYIYYCIECGETTPKYHDQCPHCSANYTLDRFRNKDYEEEEDDLFNEFEILDNFIE